MSILLIKTTKWWYDYTLNTSLYTVFPYRFLLKGFIMLAKDLIAKYGPCSEAIEWMNGHDPKSAWENCQRSDWLLWIASRVGLDRKKLVMATCAVARLSLKYVPNGEDRARLAIEAAEGWCKGTHTLEQVRIARMTAYAADAADPAAAAYAADPAAAAAYAAAYAAAAAAAAYAADAAAYAAAYAADAAAYAAAAAAAAAAYAADAAAYAAAAAAYAAAAYAAAYAAAAAAYAAARQQFLSKSCAEVRKHISFEDVMMALQGRTL